MSRIRTTIYIIFPYQRTLPGGGARAGGARRMAGDDVAAQPQEHHLQQVAASRRQGHHPAGDEDPETSQIHQSHALYRPSKYSAGANGVLRHSIEKWSGHLALSVDKLAP